VKQSPLPSRASNKRSQTTTKIFSDDRLPHAACQSWDRACEIGPFALGNDRCIAPAAESPDRERCIVRRCVAQREDDFFRAKLRMRVFTVAFKASLAIGTICSWRARRELNVKRGAVW